MLLLTYLVSCLIHTYLEIIRFLSNLEAAMVPRHENPFVPSKSDSVHEVHSGT
jgi:hypothetical protein